MIKKIVIAVMGSRAFFDAALEEKREAVMLGYYLEYGSDMRCSL